MTILLMGAGLQAAATAPIDPGIALRADVVAYWTMDEVSGTRADSTGHGNTLEDIAANVVGIPGKVNNAAVFVLDSNTVLAKTDGTVFETGDITFSIWFWVKLAAFDSRGFTIIEKADNNDTEWAIDWRPIDLLNDPVNYNTFNFYLLGADYSFPGVYSTSQGHALLDTWYFIVCEYDADNDRLRMYVNNVLADTFSWAGGTPTTTTPFSMGGSTAYNDPSWDASGDFTGRLDEVGYIKRILTPDERDYLYNSGTGRALFP